MAKPKASQRDGGGSETTGRTGGATQRAGEPAEDSDILAEARRRADEAYRAEYNNVIEVRDCQRFYAGGKAQWTEDAWNSRSSEGRPTVTINRLPQFVRQVTGEIRKNPPGIKVSPAKGGASQTTADTYSGIIRNIENQSGATGIYVKAAENQVQTGQGFFAIDLEYSSNDGFEQDIRLKAIKDPLGALVDPFGAKRLDGLDKRYAFVFDPMSIHDYKEEFPGKGVVDMQVGSAALGHTYPWRSGEVVVIAEYWRRVPIKKKLYLTPDDTVMDEAQLAKQSPEVQQVIMAGVEAGEVRMREVDDWKVEMYRMSGAAILDGPHEWAGRYIPVFMVAGEEITQEGSTVRKGMVHDARDPQRTLNYAQSASIESVALQPKAPFIGTVDQFKGRPEWKTAGSKNHAFLAYNVDKNAQGPPQRAQPAMAADGLDKQVLMAGENLKNVTGIQDASLGVSSNETSGIAIANRQREGDTATYFFVDNLRTAIGACGIALVDLIPRIYDTPRQVAILREDGSSDIVTVNGPPKMGKDDKPVHPVFNLADGEYSVTVSAGPSFATQRAESAANMIELIRARPELFGIAGDLFLKNLDFPGSAEMAKRVGKTIPPALKDDSVEEMPPPQPDPKAETEAAKNIATAQKTVAETEKTQVETATMLVQLQASMAQIVQMLAGGAGPPGLSVAGPQGPGAPVQEATPPAPPEALPPPEMNGAGDGLPPMVEVETLSPGAP